MLRPPWISATHKLSAYCSPIKLRPTPDREQASWLCVPISKTPSCFRVEILRGDSARHRVPFVSLKFEHLRQSVLSLTVEESVVTLLLDARGELLGETS